MMAGGFLAASDRRYRRAVSARAESRGTNASLSEAPA